MMQLIDGVKIAERLKTEIAQEVFASQNHPSLAIILANDREDSKLYVSLKEREAKKVGIDTHLYKIGESDSEADLLQVIDFLNKDELIDGILIQLPLPTRFNTDKIIGALDPKKDVDGFHPQHPDYVVSPVLAAMLKCLAEIKFDLNNKRVGLLYNSEVFGLSVQEAFEKLGANFQGISVKELDKLDEAQRAKKMEEILQLTKNADVLLSALGSPLFIKGEMIKPGAVLIDVGITKVEGNVLGDVDRESVASVAGYLTPVPGGIGPLTIALLFKNVLAICRQRLAK